jgi:hypothetical protein
MLPIIQKFIFNLDVAYPPIDQCQPKVNQHLHHFRVFSFSILWCGLKVTTIRKII